MDLGVDLTGTRDIPLGANAGRRTPQVYHQSLLYLELEAMEIDCSGNGARRPRCKELPREVSAVP